MDCQKKKFLFFVTIFVVAFAVRLIMVQHFGQAPVFDLLWNDAVAWNIATGHGFTASQGAPYVPGIYRSPGHPAFIAAVYSVFGHSWHVAYIAQSLLDSVTGLLILMIAAEFFSFPTAVLAGILYALYPYAAIFCGRMSQDILLTFAITLTLMLVVRAAKTPERLRLWFEVGLGLGIAAYVKPFLVLYAGVAAAVLLVARLPWKQRISGMSVVVLATTLVILPWSVRNYITFHAFLPLAVGATGENLALLVDDIEVGDDAVLAERVAQGVYKEVYKNPSAKYLREFLDGAELIQYEKKLTRESLPKLRRRWPQYLLLMTKHFPRLWISTHAVYDRPMVADVAYALSLMVLIPGIGGMLLERSRWRELTPLYATVLLITLIYVPYTLEARYTLPARPAMIIFVAACFARVVQLFKPRVSEYSPALEQRDPEGGLAN